MLTKLKNAVWYLSATMSYYSNRGRCKWHKSAKYEPVLSSLQVKIDAGLQGLFHAFLDSDSFLAHFDWKLLQQIAAKEWQECETFWIKCNARWNYFMVTVTDLLDQMSCK